MEYVDYHTYDEEAVRKLQASGIPEKLISAMIWTVYSSGDYEKSKSLVSENLKSSDEDLMLKAIQMIGDLARVYSKVDKHHLNMLEELLQSDEDYYVEEPIEDLWIYYFRNHQSHMDEFQKSHPTIYHIWWCNKVTESFIETDPEQGKTTLANSLTKGINEHVRKKVISSIEHIELFK